MSFSIVRMFLTVKHCFSEPFLVSTFALFVSFSYRCFALSWSFRSISDCTPISMFASIHSTSSLRGRGLDTHHTSTVIDTSFISAHIPPRMFGFNAVSAAVRFLCNLFLFDLTLGSSLCLVLPALLRVSVALQQLLYVVLCVLGHVSLLRKIRVVLGLRCSLSLLCDLFQVAG